MPRTCTVCVHPNREDVESLLLEGTPLRTIADRWSVSKTALIRHRDEHLPDRLLRARDAEEVATADNLLSDLRDLQQATLRILRANEQIHEDHGVALRAIGEARRNLELLARLTEMLGPDTEVTVNVAIDARVQTVILSALEDYPAARIAVAAALEELE